MHRLTPQHDQLVMPPTVERMTQQVDRLLGAGHTSIRIEGDSLDKVEKSDQMKRYLKALHNLILTDYLEFRWYVNRERKFNVRMAEIGRNNRFVPTEKASRTLSRCS
jgi:collagenase-like PrtC family protease